MSMMPVMMSNTVIIAWLLTMVVMQAVLQFVKRKSLDTYKIETFAEKIFCSNLLAFTATHTASTRIRQLSEVRLSGLLTQSQKLRQSH